MGAVGTPEELARWLVGCGMVPRGEIGLIFGGIGRSLGAVDEWVFSVIVLVVIFSTLLTAPALNRMLKRASAGESDVHAPSAERKTS